MGFVRAKIREISLKILRWCSTDRDLSKKKDLNALTPTLLTEEQFSPYKDEFEFIFGNSRIRNVAITGSYGAGKSTVMESWDYRQKLNGDGHTCTFISLAHFCGGKEGTDSVEGEILNQLIHKTKESDIPKTRFRHTRNESWRQTICKASIGFAYGCLSVTLVYLLFRNMLFLPNSIELRYPLLTWVWVISSFILVVYGARRNTIANLVRRVKIFGNEIELFESGSEKGKQKDSVFDRYMDDVLYLLNGTAADVVVFEDIDRYDSQSIKIFEKLREINELANECRSEAKGTLRFFYLVRDDLFRSPEERVKFFDYIMPVVPYIDSDSVFEELRNGLKRADIKVSDQFAYEISAYIVDSRLLKDIINESKHYKDHVFSGAKKTLSTDEAERLVSLIAYKVTFPGDFANFQKGKGFVREVLKRHEKLISDRGETLQREREELERKLESIEEQIQFNLDEWVLFNSPGSLSAFDRIINYYGSPVSGKSTLKEMVDEIRLNDEASQKLDDMIESYLADDNDVQQIDRTEDALKKRAQKYLLRIQAIDEEIDSVRYLPMADLLDEASECSIFEFNEKDFKRVADFKELNMESIQESANLSLLKHLISFGYIDESSIRFVIRAHEGGPSVEDQRNLALIMQRKSIDQKYVFEKPGDILIRLRDEHLMLPGAQNNSLLKELLVQDDNQRLMYFFRGLKRGESGRFILGYASSDQYLPAIFSVMERELGCEAAYILQNEAIPRNERRYFAHKLICAFDLWSLEENRDALRRFAYDDASFLAIQDNNAADVEANIGKTGIRLKDINFNSANRIVLNAIYEHNMYEPNAPLVRKWMEHKYKTATNGSEAIINAVFSLSPGNNLRDLVETGMDVFVATLLDITKESLKLKEGVLRWVMNNMSPEGPLPLALAEKLRGIPCKNLNAINSKQCKSSLLGHGKVVFSANNVLDYFEASQGILDDALAAFLEKGLKTQHSNKAEIDILASNELFLRAAIEAESLSLESLAVITESPKAHKMMAFDNDNLDFRRMMLVCANGCLAVTKDTLQFVRDEYPDCESMFASSNIDDYLVLVAPNEDGEAVFVFDEEIGLQILSSSTVDLEKKIEVAELFASPISIDPFYPVPLKMTIVDKHFDIGDLSLLSAEFDTEDIGLKDSITRRSLNELHQIKAEQIPLSKGLLCRVLEDESLTEEEGLDLIASQLELDNTLIGDRDSLRACFAASNACKYVELIDGRPISIPANNLNSRLVQLLMRYGMSSEKGVSDGKAGYVIVYPKGHTRKKSDSANKGVVPMNIPTEDD